MISEKVKGKCFFLNEDDFLVFTRHYSNNLVLLLFKYWPHANISVTVAI